MNSTRRSLTRLAGFVFGFLLLFEPFALLSRLIGQFVEEPGFASIHLPCVRIPLLNLLPGNVDIAGPTSLVFCGFLILVTVLCGPLFCGHICPAGGVTELLSRVVPDRFQVDWGKYVPIVPLRYGFFAGFMVANFLGVSSPCGFCNFYVLDIMVNFALTGDLLTRELSLLATFFIWFLILGLFTKGGRGFCNFLCPVGALQSLCYAKGRKMPFALGMHVDTGKCIGCGKCTRVCPMRAASLHAPAAAEATSKGARPKAQLNALHCICCGECAANCPVKAIHYGKEK